MVNKVKMPSRIKMPYVDEDGEFVRDKLLVELTPDQFQRMVNLQLEMATLPGASEPDMGRHAGVGWQLAFSLYNELRTEYLVLIDQGEDIPEEEVT